MQRQSSSHKVETSQDRSAGNTTSGRALSKCLLPREVNAYARYECKRAKQKVPPLPTLEEFSALHMP